METLSHYYFNDKAIKIPRIHLTKVQESNKNFTNVYRTESKFQDYRTMSLKCNLTKIYVDLLEFLFYFLREAS